LGRPIPFRLFYVKIHLFSWILLALLACSSIVRGGGPLLKPYINNPGLVESSNDYLILAFLAVNVNPSNPATYPVWSLQMHETHNGSTTPYTHSWTDARAAFLTALNIENLLFSDCLDTLLYWNSLRKLAPDLCFLLLRKSAAPHLLKYPADLRWGDSLYFFCCQLRVSINNYCGNRILF